MGTMREGGVPEGPRLRVVGNNFVSGTALKCRFVPADGGGAPVTVAAPYRSRTPVACEAPPHAVGGRLGRAERARARHRPERQPARRRRAGDRRGALGARRGPLLPQP